MKRELIFRLDSTEKVSKTERLASGALRIPAKLTRVGIFNYQTADGKSVRELRVPEEVFSQTSLDSFKGVPLTIGHPGKVDPSTWKQVSVGHVGDDVRRDGDFVVSSVLVHDAETIARIENKELVELSCGYECKVEPAPGNEHYDAVQRDIVGNHVAIGPRNWGRAGNEVQLYLDSMGSYVGDIGTPMAEVYTLPRMDPEILKAQLEAARAELAVAKSDGDRARAESDALKAELATLKSDSLKQDSDSKAAFEKALSLRLKASKFVGDSFDFSGKSDRDVMLAVIQASDSDFKSDSESDDYLRARFDLACAASAKATESLAKLNQDALVPAGQKDGLLESYENMRANLANAWKVSK